MILAVDTEATGLDAFNGCRPYLVTACDGEVNYWWMAEVNPYTREVYWTDEQIEEIIQLLNKAEKLVFHNANFDMRMLQSIGIPIGLYWNKVEDTQLSVHCICSGDIQDLKNLAIKYLDYWDDDEKALEKEVKSAQKVAKDKGWDIAKKGHPHFPAHKTTNYKQDAWLCREACITYGLGDVERTWLLWYIFRKSLIRDNLWNVYVNRRKLLRITYDMTSYGIYMHVNEARKWIEKKKKQMERQRWIMKKAAGIDYKFDPLKKSHLSDLLHVYLKIPVEFYTGKTKEPKIDKDSLAFYIKKYSTDKPESVVEDNKLVTAINALKRYKQHQKDIQDLEGYIKWTDENYRVHSVCKITGTRETRQSFTDPAIQTIKRSLRKFYGPPPGKVWLSLDLVNIELRIWAYDTGNPDLIAAFERNESVHIMMAKIIAPLIIKSGGKFAETYKHLVNGRVDLFKESNGQSTEAYTELKSGTFARIYGGSNLKTNQTYCGTKSKEPPDCCALIDAKLPGIGDYTKKQIEAVYKNLEEFKVPAIHTLGGYRLDVPLSETNKAPNYRVQGTAGYIMTLAMIAVDENSLYRKNKCQMVSQVHDSLDIEMPIHSKMNITIDSIIESVELAGCSIIPSCRASYKIITNEHDLGNPLLEPFLTKS